MYIDGFKYWLAYSKGTKKYYRCSRSKSSKCPGKLIMEYQKILTAIPHDHEKEFRNNTIEKFRKNLTRKAIEKPNKSLVDIYLEETQNYSEASILYPFSQAESTMRKARGKICQVLNEQKEEEKVENIKFNKSQKFFYCEKIEDVTVVLMNQATIKNMGSIEEIHVDCRIRVEYDGGEKCLVTILAFQKGRDFPLAFGLFPISSFNVSSLEHFFNFIKLKFSSNLTPSIILTSCDKNLQNSLISSFPEASIKIMFFYYAQSIIKPLSQSLLTLSKNVFNLSSLKMILAIPLIPTNYVIPGWEALRKWMREKNVDLNSICDFVYAQWLAENAEKISIFNGLAHSINNHTQVFNIELINGLKLNEVKISREPFEGLIENLLKVASKKFIKFIKLNEFETRKALKLQKIVKYATKSWISSPFHLRRPIQFLQQISHCIDDGIINFVMNYCDDIEKEKTIEETLQNSQALSLNSIKNSEECLLIPLKTLNEPPPLIFFKKS